MGDQSQSGSVRGDQRTLICNHVATRGNQRRSDVHSDAIERKSEAFKRPSEAIRCNQEAIRGHQRRSEKLTCQSGSASSPPSSSSPASTCGKRRGRHGEHLHAEARPSRGSAAPRAPRLPRGVACARRAGRGARWWSQTPLVGGARASKRANRYLPSRVIKGHQGSSRAIMGHQWVIPLLCTSVAIKGHQWQSWVLSGHYLCCALQLLRRRGRPARRGEARPRRPPHSKTRPPPPHPCTGAPDEGRIIGHQW
jgi:hypothetical protein